MSDTSFESSTHGDVLLEHRRSTARTGWNAIATLVVGGPLFFFAWHKITSAVGQEGWNMTFVIVLFVVVALFVLYCAIENIRAGKVFHCRLDRKRFTCVSPVKGFGDSFDLSVDEITKIGQPRGRSKFYVWDSDGNRFWVTNNYGNPAHRFIHHLERLRPDVQRVTTY